MIEKKKVTLYTPEGTEEYTVSHIYGNEKQIECTHITEVSKLVRVTLYSKEHKYHVVKEFIGIPYVMEYIMKEGVKP